MLPLVKCVDGKKRIIILLLAALFVLFVLFFFKLMIQCLTLNNDNQTQTLQGVAKIRNEMIK